jgi:hypothetical protein
VVLPRGPGETGTFLRAADDEARPNEGRPASSARAANRSTRRSQRFEALRISRQGMLQVSNMMPRQHRQGTGQGIGL